MRSPIAIIRRVFRKTKAAVQWAIFSWGDYDYDYSSIYRVMRWKISRIRTHLTEHNIKEGHEEVTKVMRKAERILRRLERDWHECIAARLERESKPIDKHAAMIQRHSLSQKLRRDDFDRLNEIFKNHSDAWWD